MQQPIIEYRQSDLLVSDAEAHVNTVNTVGVMGKGIALQFKLAYPENYRLYLEACNLGQVQIGKMFVTRRLVNPTTIINFPTKEHWRNGSRLEYIQQGLVALNETIDSLNIRSIAIPPLGCGNGGLDWNVVSEMIETSIVRSKIERVYLFGPRPLR